MQSVRQPRSFSADPHRRLCASAAAIATVGPTGATAILDPTTARLYALNDVGARVWALLCEGTTFIAIIDRLQREYSVSKDVLSADTENLLRQLADAKLLQVE